VPVARWVLGVEVGQTVGLCLMLRRNWLTAARGSWL
jgi:hypothetical protein